MEIYNTRIVTDVFVFLRERSIALHRTGKLKNPIAVNNAIVVVLFNILNANTSALRAGVTGKLRAACFTAD